ncbi:hypothetical protein H112_07031 [Trichophyton rubrum D6]|uniref:Uncharacterized protein n=1 Tax=Trichophyton rubrum CBS 288.86 TaxID=1215330 RepID=A0A022VU23_TRIRU|nr:hypothetical protein H100_07054 [Trichophyton rubrum MR850]EZF38832.1 hypothetical protein H102_07017 [Trichophyton rubrum CBS 100081]EZF49464.1 hypothetical protein H103_07039 [Trichophyton rubrum CBS 288.86]EZF60072.1 hypothetical protein H104_06994 [Trichophyton rubrum CBS 289.86]EZF81475.1 hypothetical protein H110_07035 [Trichophyton rubrum MR1448]EZG13608.1 hypothetical protein H107_07198 [Trichophyton rubrum CBS 202.88]KDB30575.1 hypothetical protein H112_07031 [Trichophyton rubrum 
MALKVKMRLKLKSTFDADAELLQGGVRGRGLFSSRALSQGLDRPEVLAKHEAPFFLGDSGSFSRFPRRSLPARPTGGSGFVSWLDVGAGRSPEMCGKKKKGLWDVQREHLESKGPGFKSLEMRRQRGAS